MNVRNVIGSAIAMACGVSISAVVQAQPTVIMSDDFEAMDKAAATLSGGWLWQKQYFSDAGCVSYGGQYPDNPETAKNQSYFTVKPDAGVGTIYDEYSNQGLIDNGDNNAVSGNLSLNVYQDTYSSNNDACHRSRTFKTVTTTSLAASDITPVSGNYKITGKAKVTKYDPDQNLAVGAKVGVFFLVVNNEVTPDASNSYGVMVNSYREIDINGGGVKNIAEDFELSLGDVKDISITAGFYSQNDKTVFDGGIFDDFEVSFGGLSEEQVAENAACDDTSVLRFEDAFGFISPNTKADMVTCLTDTYTIPKRGKDEQGNPTGSHTWAGFGDTKRGEQYPFYFPDRPGSVTFDCSTVSGTAEIRFKFEEAPDPTGANPGQPSYFTDKVQCSATSSPSKSVSIPVSEQVWGNMILYVLTEDVPVQVKNIKVNGSQEYVSPVPVLPIWGLLGLTGLVGIMGVRRRRKQ